MLLGTLLVATLLVAYANGANDNFKGVATLFGSGTAGYRPALLFATAATLLGSLAAVAYGQGLVRRFSGKGLVAEDLTADPSFLAAVGLAAATAVLLATRLGLPVSTTHALLGALVGAGASLGTIDLGALGAYFVLPLVASPLAAALLTGLLYPPLRSLRLRLGIERDSCLCASVEPAPVLQPAGGGRTLARLPALAVGGGTLHTCGERYGGGAVALSAQRALDVGHWLSGGALSFARGLNDAPKIASLFVAFQVLGPRPGMVAVAVVMASGGLLSARRVARTMSERITPMNSGQGFTASLVASALVLLASRFSLPVSTTHVTCGALFGLGAATGGARWRTISQILAAWVTTLPLAAGLGAGLGWALG